MKRLSRRCSQPTSIGRHTVREATVKNRTATLPGPRTASEQPRGGRGRGEQPAMESLAPHWHSTEEDLAPPAPAGTEKSAHTSILEVGFPWKATAGDADAASDVADHCVAPAELSSDELSECFELGGKRPPTPRYPRRSSQSTSPSRPSGNHSATGLSSPLRHCNETSPHVGGLEASPAGAVTTGEVLALDGAWLCSSAPTADGPASASGVAYPRVAAALRTAGEEEGRKRRLRGPRSTVSSGHDVTILPPLVGDSEASGVMEVGDSSVRT